MRGDAGVGEVGKRSHNWMLGSNSRPEMAFASTCIEFNLDAVFGILWHPFGFWLQEP